MLNKNWRTILDDWTDSMKIENEKFNALYAARTEIEINKAKDDCIEHVGKKINELKASLKS